MEAALHGGVEATGGGNQGGQTSHVYSALLLKAGEQAPGAAGSAL